MFSRLDEERGTAGGGKEEGEEEREEEVNTGHLAAGLERR